MKRMLALMVLLIALLALDIMMFDRWPCWIAWCLLGGMTVNVAMLYIVVMRPINTLINGMDLVRGQDFNSRLVSVGQADADKLVDLFNRMMDRIKEERQRKEETGLFLEQLIEASPSGIVLLDYDGKVMKGNPVAHRLLDMTEDTFGKVPSQLSGELWSAIGTLGRGDSATVRLSDNRIFRVSYLSFMDRGFVRPFIVIDTLTEDMHRAEKDAYGKVIRLMAHEVNNSMAGVKSLLETLADYMSGDSVITEVIDSCRDRCVSMSSFITAYADVVKIPEPEPRRCDLNGLVRRQHPFLEGLAAAAGGVPVSLRLSDEPVEVMADEVLIGQVLVNIVKNAAESAASTTSFAPSVEISTSSDGVLTVTDNGAGISQEVAGQLFTPFFSTKRSGRGLGLMCVSEILRRHSARFSLSTSPDDHLTRFTIRFR